MIFKLNSKRKRLIILISLLFLGIITLIAYKLIIHLNTGETLRSAVIYAGEGSSWEDTYSHLDQSLLMNMSVNTIDVENQEFDFSLYDIIYLDQSVIKASNKDQIKKSLIQFTTEGGGLFLENQFWDFFHSDFIGAEEFVKLNSAPKDLEFPEVRHNLKEMQEIIQDFDYIYKDYIDYELLDTYDYGYGIKGSNGEVLAEENGIALYTVNKVGNGYVFFTNPLLPNYFNINGFSMKATNDLQKYFANTTASSNQILKDRFAGFLSKEKYGFSVERVFGNYGRPSMAWQLHYEEITGIENNSAKIFAELCETNLQIPSYTIIRNSYNWFNRHEAITYLLNESLNGDLTFAMDEYENAYSSGNHMVSDGQWLSLEVIKKAGSYFKDYPNYDQRAYPFTIDYNKDGFMDIIAGSADGNFHYFKGEGMGDNYETSKPIRLTNSNGEDIKVQGYSAPIMLYINEDENIDLITGSSDGNIYWFSGNGDLTFEKRGILVETHIEGQIMPTMGDINEDGVVDLIIGSNLKTIKIYYGKKANGKLSFLSATDIKIEGLENIEGNWLAPYIIDINKDGMNDLVIGTFHGYIGRFIRTGQIFKFDGYMEGTQKNYKENNNLKFGNNCIPSFSDLNHDGNQDLIVGSLEYGLAYPIDSVYFPFKDKLEQQIKFMNERGYYTGMHFYTNVGASSEYEVKELEMHIAALKQYGVKVSEPMGFNQHTWHTSAEDETQTLKNGLEAGLLWCSGFKPSRSDATPERSAETAINIPFLFGEKATNRLLVFNTSTMLYDQKGWGDISAKYDLPVSMYYHCDFAYEDPEKAENDILKASDFATKYDYNFVKEDQYVKSIAASYNTDMSVVISNKKDKLKITLRPKIKDKTSPLYDEDYQSSIGVKIVLGEKYKGKKIKTTSPVWYQKDDIIYMGAGEDTIISEEGLEKLHINKVNLPIEVKYTDSGTEVKFKDGGIMQLEVEGNATTKDEGWIITKSRNRDATIFTKFGISETVNIEKIN